MLAEFRGVTAERARGERKLGRHAQLLIRAPAGVHQVDDHLPLAHLRIAHHLVQVEHRFAAAVRIGKQLLMTRGALTTFSIANDAAKYFAILPAMFVEAFPQIAVLDIMHLASPRSAILSAVIFNAVIIVLLIPLALRGVRYRPVGAEALLRRSLLIYGLGGMLAPFAGIKAIDLLLRAAGFV